MEEFLGQKIRQIRETLGLGRQAFADQCEIKKKSLENIETGKQRATEELIVAIGRNWPEYAFWLITGRTIPEAGQISPEIEESREKLGKAG